MLQRPSGRAVAALAAVFMILAGPGWARAQASGGPPTVEEARAFVEAAEERLLDLSTRAGRAAWVQANFITDDTQRIASDLNKDLIAASMELAKAATRFDGMTLPPELARKLKLIKLAPLPLPAPSDSRLQAGVEVAASMLLCFALAARLLAAGDSRPFSADPPKVCDSCAEWNAPRAPFRVFGNTHYVGTGALTSALITSDDGHILVDGGLTQSAALVDASIRALGFRTEDVRLIVSSHAHFDHAGGIAALQRASRAAVAASAAGARALAAGGPTADDPQYGLGVRFNSFPPVKDVRAVGDGETLRVGRLAITAHLTPGHTPGSTSWTWRSCEGPRCVDIVYADSLTAASADGFRFRAIGDGGRYVAAFRRGIETIAKLPCDVLLTPHPSASGMDEKFRRRSTDPGDNAFVDPGACRAYAEAAARGLDRRLAEEASTPAVSPAP